MKPVRFPFFALLSLFSIFSAGAQQSVSPSPTPSPTAFDTNKATLNHEPTNAAEATAQNKYLGKLTPEEYQRWDAYVLSKPAAEQEWLRTLEKLLGSFYAPPYMKDLPAGKTRPETDGWAYVKDDPALPRVLIIGDSISRSYTAPVRMALAGKANVHRAPANCGPTDNFFKDGEIWTNQNGSNRWDVIVFNFGIHDRKKPSDLYAANLRKVYARLKELTPTVIWVETTPFADKEDAPGTDRSIPINETGNALAKEQGVDVVHLHDLMLPELSALQNPDRVHFNQQGTVKMGNAVAETISRHLAPTPAPAH